ncbi:hypothetical protein [Brevibacillus agri]|uniref:hypothetical protein n=1 Tax=Brevibacillus agri TaxID=51101 RepID=UPI003D244A76
MKKKFVIGALTIAMATVGFTPAFASSQNNLSPTYANSTQDKQFKKVEIDAQALSTVASSEALAMDKYVYLGNDGFLHIDKEAKTFVSEKVYDTFERGVNNINKGLRAKKIAIVNGDLVLVKTNSKNQGVANWRGEVFWWGVSLQYNDSETKELVNILTSYGNKWALAAAISAFVPGGQEVAIAAAIMSYGNYELAREIGYQNKGRGVNIDIAWVGTISIYGR